MRIQSIAAASTRTRTSRRNLILRIMIMLQGNYEFTMVVLASFITIVVAGQKPLILRCFQIDGLERGRRVQQGDGKGLALGIGASIGSRSPTA